MRKFSKGSRFLAMLLVLVMTLSMAPLNAFAAKGEIVTVGTGLTGNINTSDTISLPIRIMDYEADGMLFEFAEAAAGKTGIAAAKTAADFGASKTAESGVSNISSGLTSVTIEPSSIALW